MSSDKLLTTPFDASSTAAEVIADIDLAGVRAVVTGASSGLGVETARALVSAGAEVTLAVRNTSGGAAAAETIGRETGRPAPAVSHLDLARPATIARVIDEWQGALHLLVNNAGVVTGGLERTAVGWELQFATNHLGHFALAVGLHDALARGADDRGDARIVSLSSTAHMRADVDFDDLHFERRGYDPQIAYAQSKTANSLFSVEATRLWSGDGIFTNTVNPGGIVTGLQRNFTATQRASLDAAEAAGSFTYKTIAQGAATSILAATTPALRRIGARYLDDCREAYPVANDASLADHPHGVKRWALDPEHAERLWKVSTEHFAA